MPIIIGVDEAGYGPNLGPLVVAATVWQVADGVDGAALYKLLRRVVAGSVEKAARKRIVWADSKAVYKSGAGLDHLERGVLAALALVDCRPRDWRELWESLDRRVELGAIAAHETAVATAFSDELPWHVDYSTGLPLWCDRDELGELVTVLTAGLSSAGVRLLDVLARPVFPGEFNVLVDGCGTKSDALSRVTLKLVERALEASPAGQTIIYCDKHGARNRYHALLQSQFAEAWIEVRFESDAKSVYRFQLTQRPVEVGFWMAGEQFLPVALASMAAKYLRETAMRPFNEFWCARVPGLKPTAGYPLDSRRFKTQIAAVQRELGIADEILWRRR